MSQNTFSMAGGVARNPLVRLAKPVTATIGADEHIAIVGPNGSGKSLFVDTLIGKYPLREGALQYDFSPSATQTVYDNVKYIAFRDTYGAADANYYYQQRWNAHDQDEAPDVREMLGEIKDEQLKNELFDLFRIEPLLDKKIILLSSGELRKFQLTKTLLTAPRVLIMDNPFIGLDAPTRELLFSLLDRLTKMSSVQIILVLSMLDDIPSFITHVIPVDKMEVFPKMEREVYLDAFRSRDTVVHFDDLQQRIIDLPYNGNNYDADEVVKLNKVSIRYGDRTILKELDWTVHRGEKWALSGENGAGKSTTINILCTVLEKTSGNVKIGGYDLDKEKNKIKELIGIVFQGSVLDKQLNVKENLESRASYYGLNKKEIAKRIESLTQTFDLSEILKRKYGTLSGGQRRRVDIARALINRPKLLFLDEPTTGLDPKTRLQVWEIIHNLRKETGLTVFLTTHYMEETVDCDNVVIIDSGKIVANDSPHNLKKDYSSNSLVWYTEENSENDNLLKADNLEFERVGDAYKIKIKNSRQALEITNKHTEIVDFEIIKGNMDDVFLTVTGKRLGD